MHDAGAYYKPPLQEKVFSVPKSSSDFGLGDGETR